MEKTIFVHRYNAEPYYEIVYQYEDETNSLLNRFSDFLSKGAKVLAVSGVLVLGITFGPNLIDKINDSAGRVSSLLAQTAKAAPEGKVNTFSIYQPKYEATLPKENTLEIASIGVNAQLNEATVENYEEALEDGIWRVSDFGTPAARENPTILAAHRYGYLAWTNLFRRERSFYNLPNLKEGELVEIVWRQRKYVYEVYATSEGEEIEDYSADLILYTCKDLNSPVRIFKYARLLEI